MARRLIVTVPFWKGDDRRWSPFLDRLDEDPSLGEDIILRWNYNPSNGSLLSPSKSIARELNGAIEEHWNSGDYDGIILVGHSLGALLCRQAFLFAVGAETGYAQRSEWGSHVERIVLFGGISRGLDWENGSLPIKAANALLQWLPLSIARLWRDIARGSSFLTNLRIHWLRHFAMAGDQTPEVIHFLGARDGIVSRSDCIDVEQAEKATHVDLAWADHASVVQPEAAPDPAIREIRYNLLRDRILSGLGTSDPEGVTSSKRETKGADHVVFLTHGIRAFAFDWPRKAEALIEARDPSIRLEIPTKGFFSALRFAWPPTRRRNLQLFRDRYTKAFAKNPQARFDYIGHSNGTYLLGHNLLQIPAMHFDRVVVAASVLPPDYPWDQRFASGQVRLVRADYAAADFPVGILCSALRWFGMRDVGPGGLEGFHEQPVGLVVVGWHDGNHSRMLKDDNLSHIVDFVLNDEALTKESLTKSPLVEKPRRWLLKAMPLAGISITIIIGAILTTLMWFVASCPMGNLSIRLGIAATIVVLGLFAADTL